MMTRAARTHQAGHTRPAGRVFETPELENHFRQQDCFNLDHNLSLDLLLSINMPNLNALH